MINYEGFIEITGCTEKVQREGRFNQDVDFGGGI